MIYKLLHSNLICFKGFIYCYVLFVKFTIKSIFNNNLKKNIFLVMIGFCVLFIKYLPSCCYTIRYYLHLLYSMLVNSYYSINYLGGTVRQI